MGFRKVGIGEILDPKAGGKDSETIGVYLGKQENVGPNKSVLHNLKVNGKEVQIWGSSVLDTRLAMILPGTKIKIVYLGQFDSQQRKGSTYHNFDVFEWVDDGTEESAEKKSDTPAKADEKDDLPF